MLFFSELIGKRVFVDDTKYIGKLRDIIFLNEDTPIVTKIIVASDTHRIHEIPIGSLRRANNHVVIAKTSTAASTTNELSVSKVLLDQQIIDLIGNKVVRANDVILQDVPVLSVSGIDIGILGILRRLGVEAPVQKVSRFFHMEIPMQLLSWGDVLSLELDHGQIKIKQREEKLAKIHEEDLADYLEMTNIQNAHTFISTLGPKKAAQVVESLTINYQIELFQQFDLTKAAELINLIDPDEAVDILLAIDRIKRDKIMHLLPVKKQQDLHQLMTFSRTPVGRRMTSEYFTVASHQTVKEILTDIKVKTTDFSALGAIYVLNREDQLVGVFNSHELLMQNLDTPAYKFMVPEPIVALLTTPIEVIIYKLLKYNVPALPIINRDKKILGVITLDDVSEILLKKIQ